MIYILREVIIQMICLMFAENEMFIWVNICQENVDSNRVNDNETGIGSPLGVETDATKLSARDTDVDSHSLI